MLHQVKNLHIAYPDDFALEDFLHGHGLAVDRSVGLHAPNCGS
jgi:hypothetical protein